MSIRQLDSADPRPDDDVKFAKAGAKTSSDFTIYGNTGSRSGEVIVLDKTITRQES